ncbi:MAG: hypothetical protein U5P10_00760 [Spirochaetia bacterium]|nr:hypothetical protein [Spirochaetia bacterium]
MVSISLDPIGYVSTKASSVPRFYSISDVRGELVIDEQYEEGLTDIRAGSSIERSCSDLRRRSHPFAGNICG